jgi:hypothetical protein
MWFIIQQFLVRNARIISVPIAGIFGFIGYHLEGYISDRHTPSFDSVMKKRQDRLLNSDTNTTNKKHNPLDVNLSPSLSS